MDPTSFNLFNHPSFEAPDNDVTLNLNSPPALSLIYWTEDTPGYSRQELIDDLLREHEMVIHQCFKKGSHKVPIDRTRRCYPGLTSA